MELQRDYPLLEHNTFGMDVKANAFFEFESEEALCDFLRTPFFDGYRRFCMTIGAGSNLLFAGDYRGLLLHSAIRSLDIVKEDEESVWVRVGSGYVWDDFVAWSVEHGYAGAENLSAIPGEVGASAVQNIGAYGVEVCQLIDKVEVIDTYGCPRTFTNEECRYGYRDSIFKNDMKNRCIVTYVTYRLSKSPVLHLDYGNLRSAVEAGGVVTPAAVREAVKAIRAAKLPDPKVTGNAGSFFKNPVIESWQYDHLRDVYPSIPCYPVDDKHVKVPAGWLIEQCGWKGRSLGRAAVHEHQALVLVNTGGATGREVMALAIQIVEDVRRKFGIDIVPEVNLVV